MGLDITAYRKIEKLDCVFDSDGYPIDPKTGEPLDWQTYFFACVNPEFPRQADGIKDGNCYKFEEDYKFRAGSFLGYNHWREQLAKLAGYPAVLAPIGNMLLEKRHDEGAEKSGGGPFYELICFSDCEGVIGPKTSAKLAQDFQAFQESADQHEDERFRSRYNDWRKAFEMASESGCVRFY